MSYIQDVLFKHIEARLPKLSVDVVFDVGAHLGESCEDFKAQFPNSKIFAFEPTAESFALTAKKFSADSSVKVVNAGLGRSNQ